MLTDRDYIGPFRWWSGWLCLARDGDGYVLSTPDGEHSRQLTSEEGKQAIAAWAWRKVVEGSVLKLDKAIAKAAGANQ